VKEREERRGRGMTMGQTNKRDGKAMKQKGGKEIKVQDIKESKKDIIFP
jgi:hypothetical protein